MCACVCVCVCVCVCEYLLMHTDGTVEPATQETTLIQNHTYGHLNHHTHPPIPHSPTSDDIVYSMLTNAHKTTPQGGGYEHEIVDEIRRGKTTGEMTGEERKEKAYNLDSTQSQDET